jgi:lipopolysaccharide/colanic/teichoic acid biosynthesis glycosyltransferase
LREIATYPSWGLAVSRGPLRLKRPASQTRLLSRVAILDVAWGGATPFLAFLLRDWTINSPQAVIVYCGVALLASLVVSQWLRTSSPIFRYFSLRDASDLLKACVLIAMLSAASTFLFTRLDDAPRSVPILHLTLLYAGLLAVRLYARIRDTRREASGKPRTDAMQHVLIVQASRLAWFFAKMVEELEPGECQIVAILDDRPELQQRSLNGYPVAGTPANIEKVIDEYAMHGIRIDKVVAATQPQSLAEASWERVLQVCHDRQIEVEVLPERLISSGSPAAKKTPVEFRPVQVSALGDLQAQLAQPFWKVKRLIDVAIAFAAAILTFPIGLLVFCLALMDVGIPVLFWQQRAGRNGAPLHLYKIRTLQTIFDPRTKQRREANRPSAFGRFLQRTRLDELPQLWNIISGDMSLIGPRPLLPIDQPKGPSIRLAVRPGLSGWAQVCGGKSITPEEKNALDEWYIRHASLYLDAAIVLRTLAMMSVGDRRDEKAIANAIAERCQYQLETLPDSINAQIEQQRRSRRNSVAVMRASEAPGSSSSSDAASQIPSSGTRPGTVPALRTNR